MNHTTGECRSCGDPIHKDDEWCEECASELVFGVIPPASRITASRPGRPSPVPEDHQSPEDTYDPR